MLGGIMTLPVKFVDILESQEEKKVKDWSPNKGHVIHYCPIYMFCIRAKSKYKNYQIKF